MKTRIKLNGLVLIVALILCILFPYLWLRRTEGKFDDFIEAFGICLILFGFLLRASARGFKAENSASGNALVTGGPYSLVRNPMYLGIVVSGVGIILVIGRLWALLLFLGGFLARYLYLFKKEEKSLERAFGQPYLDYKKTVPRIIPDYRSFFRRDIRDYLPLKAQWFKGEMISIVPIMLGVIGLESWEEFHADGWIGVCHNLTFFLAVILVFAGLTNYLIIGHEKTRVQSDGQR